MFFVDSSVRCIRLYGLSFNGQSKNVTLPALSLYFENYGQARERKKKCLLFCAYQAIPQNYSDSKFFKDMKL